MWARWELKHRQSHHDSLGSSNGQAGATNSVAGDKLWIERENHALEKLRTDYADANKRLKWLHSRDFALDKAGHAIDVKERAIGARRNEIHEQVHKMNAEQAEVDVSSHKLNWASHDLNVK